MPTWGGSTLEVPGVRPADGPGVGGRRQPHRYRVDDRRVRHGVPGRGRLGRQASNLNVDTWDQTDRQPRHRQGQQSWHEPVHAAGPAHDRRPQRLVPRSAERRHAAAADQPVLRAEHRAAGRRQPDRDVHCRSARAPTSTPSPTSASPPRGTAPPNWPCPATSCCSVTAPSHGAPFLRINEIPIGGVISLIGDDGHSYNYVVVRQDVTVPNFNLINNIGLSSGLATVQLVACTPPHSVTFRWVTTARLVSVTLSVGLLPRSPTAAGRRARRPRRPSDVAPALRRGSRAPTNAAISTLDSRRHVT